MHPLKTAGNLGGCKIGPTPVEFSRRDPRHPPRRRKASRAVCVGHRTGPKKTPTQESRRVGKSCGEILLFPMEMSKRKFRGETARSPG